jgi:hypothetical protein
MIERCLIDRSPGELILLEMIQVVSSGVSDDEGDYSRIRGIFFAGGWG